MCKRTKAGIHSSEISNLSAGMPQCEPDTIDCRENIVQTPGHQDTKAPTYPIDSQCSWEDVADGTAWQYTWGEVTSQNLWSRYDLHFVGITWHNVWS